MRWGQSKIFQPHWTAALFMSGAYITRKEGSGVAALAHSSGSDPVPRINRKSRNCTLASVPALWLFRTDDVFLFAPGAIQRKPFQHRIRPDLRLRAAPAIRAAQIAFFIDAHTDHLSSDRITHFQPGFVCTFTCCSGTVLPRPVPPLPVPGPIWRSGAGQRAA